MRTKFLLTALLLAPLSLPAVPAQILGWNNLGMHCMDSDYSVFSILPPYNTIEVQLIVGGDLVTEGTGYTVTYEAVADPDGSFNSTAMGKGNFYAWSAALYGATPPPEMGLAGWGMPGLANTPQAMLFEPTNYPAPGVATKVNWFRAEGIPITPWDDDGNKNPYPLMRVIAWNGSGTPIATNDIVLPVSDEMDCRACHASGTSVGAEPAAGWVWSGNPERDYRLNILRLHDENQFAEHADLYQSALAARGFSPQGLYHGVAADQHPVLCAACHASEALGTGSYSNIPPLTAAVHARHAQVMDPELHITLDNSEHRAACYRCHPGSATQCLRGAMGGAIANDGTMAMQCQSCHGSMSQVGSLDRVGWFMEPNCQSCHTGTATSNNGEIRYTSAFEPNGAARVAVNQTFATNPDNPADGLSLYRFSTGHGGLQCSACHGSTHAEFPATHRNDNLRNEAIQGHAGVMVECTSCHTSMPSNNSTAAGGPHGMHPIGAGWISFHHDAIDGDNDHLKCAACHGSDFRGSVLSESFANRTFNVHLDGGNMTLNLFSGALVGCYTCHNGPRSESINSSAAPLAADISTNTASGHPVSLELPVSGAGAVARIISQPQHGSVGLSNKIATYFPDSGFVGTDAFTFAGWDGAKNSSLATATVTVIQGSYALLAQAYAPPTWPSGWPAPFAAVGIPSNILASVTYEWDFGDQTPVSNQQYSSHVYAEPGIYHWKVMTRVLTAATTNRGTIEITVPAKLELASAGGEITATFSADSVNAVLERSPTLDVTGVWSAATNAVQIAPGVYRIMVPETPGQDFYRARQVQ